MTVQSKKLVAAAQASNSQTTVYTAPTLTRTIIDKCSGYNGTAGPVTLGINLVDSGGTASSTNLLMSKSIAAGEAYTFPEIVGHVLEAGDFVSVIAGAATSIVFRMSGREVS
jgi:hypothetical protein